MQKIEKPPTTPKQQEILLQLYRFRFLKSVQLQKMLGYKSVRKINIWLKDLVEKNYVKSLQLPSVSTIKSPFVYYTGSLAIACLRERSGTTEVVLRRLRHNKRASKEFIEKKLLAADIASGLGTNGFNVATSSSITNPESGAYEIYQMGLSPDLVLQDPTGVIYLLEVMAPSVPGYAIRRRIKLYLEFQRITDWDLRMVIVCDNRAQKGIIHRAIRQSRENWQILLKEDVSKIAWA